MPKAFQHIVFLPHPQILHCHLAMTTEAHSEQGFQMQAVMTVLWSLHRILPLPTYNVRQQQVASAVGNACWETFLSAQGLHSKEGTGNGLRSMKACSGFPPIYFWWEHFIQNDTLAQLSSAESSPKRSNCCFPWQKADLSPPFSPMPNN